MSQRPSIDYSIVLPVYYNEGSLSRTMEGLLRDVIAEHPSLNCEVIFVDDGSGDGSFDELLSIRERYPHLVRLVKFTRNFGQVSALMAGFAQARGRCVVAMSADGQDPPSLINDMLAAHLKDGYEIVICTRQGRDESIYRIATSRLFYKVMKKLTFPNMPEGGFDFVLLGRKAIAVMLRNQDAHPFFQGQILWTGFRTKFIEYHRQQRTAGISRWTFGKKLTYLIDGVMSYSFVPIRVISIAGIVVAFAGFIYALVILAIKIFWGLPVQGWAPLMIVVLVMGGFQMLMLGVVGEYLWRTLAQVRNRDPYIIEAVYDDNGVHPQVDAVGAEFDRQ